MREFLARHGKKVQWSCYSLIAATLVVLAGKLPLGALVGELREWVAGQGVTGVLGFGVLYAAAIVLLLPGSVLTLAAGALFGVALGTAIASVAATTGALLAFLIARHLARDRVTRIARQHPAVTAISEAFGKQGWKLVALLRLSPFVPFSLGNYLLGLTEVRLVPYVVATWLGAMPGTLMYVYLGHVGGAAATGRGPHSPLEWALLGLGIAVTVGLTIYLGRVAKKAVAQRGAATKSHAHASREPVPKTIVLVALAAVCVVLTVVSLVRPDWLDDLFSVAGGRK